MKRFIVTLATLAVLSTLSFAQDGAALYKSKCAMCHGAAGEGKVGPSLQKTSMTEAQIAGFIADGHLVRHLRKMRNIYGLRRQLLLNCLEEDLSDWLAPIPSCYGMHVAAVDTGRAISAHGVSSGHPR